MRWAQRAMVQGQWTREFATSLRWGGVRGLHVRRTTPWWARSEVPTSKHAVGAGVTCPSVRLRWRPWHSGLGGGAVYAYFTSHGSGTGHATTGSAQSIAVTAQASPSADATLFPGGSGSAVHFNVSNPNPYAVSFTGWSGATVSSVTPLAGSTCTSGDFTITSAAGSFATLNVAAETGGNPGTASGTANGVVGLKSTAQTGCQGATVSVTLTLTGGKSS